MPKLRTRLVLLLIQASIQTGQRMPSPLQLSPAAALDNLEVFRVIVPAANDHATDSGHPLKTTTSRLVASYLATKSVLEYGAPAAAVARFMTSRPQLSRSNSDNEAFWQAVKEVAVLTDSFLDGESVRVGDVVYDKLVELRPLPQLLHDGTHGAFADALPDCDIVGLFAGHTSTLAAFVQRLIAVNGANGLPAELDVPDFAPHFEQRPVAY